MKEGQLQLNSVCETVQVHLRFWNMYIAEPHIKVCKF